MNDGSGEDDRQDCKHDLKIQIGSHDEMIKLRVVILSILALMDLFEIVDEFRIEVQSQSSQQPVSIPALSSILSSSL